MSRDKKKEPKSAEKKEQSDYQSGKSAKIETSPSKKKK
ncbi:hypothetical protein ADIARSV_3522 [Arcticibacter svalbardensis MN12-7]|uniref:Uncharacterized protein n=1 Tax=Arcticibacter svalbardensis MN12-7 TaxID=1150600 RepID=R9GNN2_9SPHI|nr:hypothetical protein ADIARSV_3522 [Arcticibacter svalbardensis MN12-7]